MSGAFLLFESASGYAIFEVTEAEEIGSLLSEVQSSVTEMKRFSKFVKLKAFQPFVSAENALENIMKVSENLVHEDLQTFLEGNLPKVKKAKKQKMYLGVMAPNLGVAIQEEVGFPCKSNELVLELLRGIRFHFEKFVSKLDNGASGKAQLGLGHSYSRAKVKFNVNRQDNMIIQSICLLDQLDKDVNTCAMRVKEWYSWHFPELAKIVSDSFIFARLVKTIGARSTLTNESLEKLTEITMDEPMAQQILDAAKSSMGFEVSEIDMMNLSEFADRVVELAKYRKQLSAYLVEKMAIVAPNLAGLIGETVAARLISHAGSLVNLAKCPASTIQILGAEKALFRALKTKGNTPKYGLIFHSSFIGRAKAKNKGRISRYLANKCAIASRIDSFSETPNSLYGDKLREQVEDRLKFYDSGETPKKNIDVMREVAKQIAAMGKENGTADDSEETPKKKNKKDKKKSKKRKAEDEAEADADAEDEEKPKKKKKKKKAPAADEESPKKKKKKDKDGKKKKKKKKTE
eukprot:CAMPEP_0204833096 /NCGR_PEP_ID=MMETSP1346-20131115/15647_1 /ASSEMBLY_ACC=CAM_ASM_000771 /TAXON_ID=215587 /ORGANISM="Aplanochytrium stocchinoi, Strain GSBS06" /LENGTH=518 /DNA_ID=CAMNT_0051965357 /DNA_START=163 /DNA_END=1719 /DNA_ORIENTATION=-